MGKLADNVLTVREDCSPSGTEVSEPPTHARLRYVSCAGVTAGAHVAELDSTAVVMNKSAVFAEAGVPKYVWPSEFLPISAAICLPRVRLAAGGGGKLLQIKHGNLLVWQLGYSKLPAVSRVCAWSRRLALAHQKSGLPFTARFSEVSALCATQGVTCQAAVTETRR